MAGLRMSAAIARSAALKGIIGKVARPFGATDLGE
jgi:choline dehydrogenase